MKAILVDDEPDCVAVLSLLLAKHCPQVTVCDTCTTAAEAIKSVRRHAPDILFLDIEMPVMNGFQLLDELGALRFNLIFTTAYDKFAVRAFRYSALDYLLKPIDPVELKTAVEKSAEKYRIEKLQIDLLREQLFQTGPKIQNKIALPYKNGYTIVETDTILYCESDGSYTRFYFANGEMYLITKALGEVEDTLAGSDFYRIHKQYFVNLRHIARYVRGDGGYIVMPDGKSLPIARSRKDEFGELFRHL